MVSGAKPRWAKVPIGRGAVHVVPIWCVPGSDVDDWTTFHEVDDCWCCPRICEDGVVIHFDRRCVERH